MSMHAIRWDNINGANLTEASRPLESAQRGFMGGFDALSNTLQQRQTMEDQNWQNTRTNNTNAFLDAVTKYRTPEELRAAQAEGGALDQLRQQYGPQVDTGAIRGAADSRVAALQQQAQQEIAYNHMMTDERVAPLLDQFKQATLDKDPVKAAAAQAKYAELGGRDLASLASYADARANELKLRGYTDENHDLGIRKGNQEISASQAHSKYETGMLGVSQGQLQVARGQLGLQNEQLQYSKEDRLTSQLQKSLESLGSFATMSPGSPEGQAKIADYIDKIKDPDIQSNARKAAAALSGQKDMTVAGVLAGIGSIDKRDWFTQGHLLFSNSNNVDDAVARGKAFVGTPDALTYQKRQEVGYDASRKNYESIDSRLKDLRDKLYRPKVNMVANPTR